MDFDFDIFQINLLLALRQTAPLDENLRTVMAPSLWRIKRYCDANAALHVFFNKEVGELHVMALGTGDTFRQALEDEMVRRHTGDQPDLVPRSSLPSYVRFEMLQDSDLPQLLDRLEQVRHIPASAEIVELLRQLVSDFPQEFNGLTPSEEDNLIIIPLGTKQYWRLGAIILWSAADKMAKLFQNSNEQEKLIAFRKSIEHLLIGVFTNFYRMVPHTYLPSYYRVERKPVALLCAELRDFDRISEILRQPHDYNRERALKCLGTLVNRFTEKAAEVIEHEPYRGRIDQIWGNGLLAVFGEYMDIQEPSHKVTCMRAVAAAADLVVETSQIVKDWLMDDFGYDKFQQYSNEHIALYPVAAVDYGDVVFDYVGSSKNRVYMSVGDHVNFVKQLAGMVGYTESNTPELDALLQRLLPFGNNPAAPYGSTYDAAPILLSQTAFTGSKHILKPLPQMPPARLHQAKKIHLPGKPALYSVYEIWPANVDR